MVTLKKIFVSSTYRDLVEERKIVKDAILGLGHHPAGMEMFGARTIEQWRVIEDEIDCSDYYIIIVGKCFGTIVPGEEISYTQKEFRYAKGKGIPILGFISRDEANLMKDINKDKIDRLKRFKNEIETSKITIAYWLNGDNLATQIVTAITKEIHGNPEINATRNFGEGIELRDGWNFHNDIALQLENKARSVFDEDDRPYTKIYDADGIETGYFAEVMIDILRTKSERENNREDIDQFIRDLAPFIGKSGYEIPHKTAQGFLDYFYKLMQ